MSVNRGVDKPPQSVIESQVQLPRCFVAGRGGEALPPLRTFFYIDALNLYYGALRDTPYRWLDINKFCVALLQQKPHFNEDNTITDNFVKWRLRLPFLFKTPQTAFNIVCIKIFTAPLKTMPWDTEAPARQKNYLTALKAHDSKQLIKICYGQFSVRKKTARDAEHPHQKRKIVYPEEKGSDVNLALHMLNDAVNNEYDCAVMVSNDTDLVSALKMVQARGQLVGVGFPLGHKRSPAHQLKAHANFYINFNAENASSVACQLPDIVPNPKGGNLHCPPTWKRPRQRE